MAEQSSNEAQGETQERSVQSLRDLLERAFLVGVGAAALTKDRVQEIVEEFVRRGQLSTEEGREMVDRLLARSRDEARSAFRRADSSLQGTYKELGLVTRRELEDLEFRLRQLEHRVSLLEAASDAGLSDEAGGGSPTDQDQG